MTNEREYEVNEDLRAHEERINEQIILANRMISPLDPNPDPRKNPHETLAILHLLSAAGLRLVEDTDRIVDAARDIVLAERADAYRAVIDSLPPEVKEALDALAESGVAAYIATVNNECTNPDCPVHGRKSDD